MMGSDNTHREKNKSNASKQISQSAVQLSSEPNTLCVDDHLTDCTALNLCYQDGCSIDANRCDPLFSLSPFNDDRDSSVCHLGLPYNNSCNGGTCEEMFTVDEKQVCEYCKVDKSSPCRSWCERPHLYFARRRPAFGNGDGYDKTTGFRILKCSAPVLEEAMVTEDTKLTKSRSWKIPLLFPNKN